jgi:hypothetical protein
MYSHWFMCLQCTDEQKKPAELLQTLETFMESSSVGEYSTRLEMLLAFHCHLVSVEGAPGIREVQTQLKYSCLSRCLLLSVTLYQWEQY